MSWRELEGAEGAEGAGGSWRELRELRKLRELRELREIQGRLSFVHNIRKKSEFFDRGICIPTIYLGENIVDI